MKKTYRTQGIVAVTHLRQIFPLRHRDRSWAASPSTASATLGNYPATSMQLRQANTTVTPFHPTLTVAISVSTSTNFRGRLEGNPNTGVVRITDAHPAGVYTVTVTGFDSSGIGTHKMFTLTVTTLLSTCNPVDFKAGTDFGVTASAIAVADFNRDDDVNQDVAVADAGWDAVSILLGNGTGGFSPATNASVGNGVFALAVGDFSGDGNEDLSTANIVASTVTIRFGDGLGGFCARRHYYSCPSNPQLRRGGRFQRRRSSKTWSWAISTPPTVAVMLGDSTGAFGALTNFQVSSALPR